jgi:predicted O-methyltransferase YrrM
MEINVRSLLKKVVSRMGYEVLKASPPPDVRSPFSPLIKSSRVTDIDLLAGASLSIPGMVTQRAGRMLYSLCYMQSELGDVVEIGSWQGRSTSFLARAAKDSGNGKVYAVDHFKGNVGREKFYVVGRDDLGDLKSNFLNNLKRVGISDQVTLLDMPNDAAVRELNGAKIRFLFIDGDHTRPGVEKDIELFFPFLVDGAIVVFDDFNPQFTGVVEAVDSLIARRPMARTMCYHNTFVVKL